MLLGSGELGKEFVIAVKRLGHYVIAVDSYNDAPAQQVADEREVINMLDGKVLDALVAKHQPDIIVPEIEAIRTERFLVQMALHIPATNDLTRSHGLPPPSRPPPAAVR